MDNSRDYNALELNKILEMLAGKCSSSDAADMARSLQPQTNFSAVQYMLSQTADAYMLAGRFGTPSFGGISNVDDSLKKAKSGASLSTGELLRIAGVLKTIRTLREWRNHCEGVTSELDGLFMALVPNRALEENITSSILSEDTISDYASSELANIRRKIKSAENRVREQLDKMLRSSQYQKYLQELIVTIRDGRFVVPVKAEFRGNVAGLVHDTSSSGATVFIEPMGVVEANNDIRILRGSEQEEIDRILAALSSDCGENADVIMSSCKTAVQLDLLFAKANLAYEMRASLPTLSSSNVIDLKKARHPLIDKDKVVASDISLGREFDTLLITGPNTGGKTVSLKTLGLLTAMTMCGLMIPASDNSEVSFFEKILVDIGDEQSIEQSLSTFSAHMTNIIRILELADEHSLVLLDELGAGTDPVEGAALAEAIIEELRAKGAKVAATTHYAELKSYALRTDGVENGSCEFDVNTLTPTYRLLIGTPGRSNAFAICSQLGMPENIVRRAGELVSDEDKSLDDVIAGLDSVRQSAELKLSEAERMKSDAQKLKSELDAREESLKKSAQKEKELAREEAARIISRAKGEADELLEDINKLRKDYESAKISALNGEAKASLRSRLRKLEASIDPVEERSNAGYVLPRELRVGDTVEIYGIHESGIVTGLPDKTGNVEIQMGIIKSRVKLSDIRLVESGQITLNGRKRQRQKRVSHDVERKDVQTEVDLRGCTVEDAILEADRAIDHAVMMKLGEIRIIHGKGTGALRAGLHEHFKRHPSIQSFRLGVYGEGESGVTIVKLKDR